MENQLNTFRSIRKAILALLEPLTDEQLNHVPTGFNNNLLWNLGHLLTTQQGIAYLRAGLAPVISEELMNRYKSGTKPEQAASSAEIIELKSLFLSIADTFEADIARGLFAAYPDWTHARTGIEVNGLTGVLGFLTFHESLHYGYMMAMKKTVLQELS